MAMESELQTFGLADDLERSRQYFGISSVVEEARAISFSGTVDEDICIEQFLRVGLADYYDKLSNDKNLPISVIGQDVMMSTQCAYHTESSKVLSNRFETVDTSYRVLHDLEDSVPLIKGGVKASVEASDKVTCVSINARNDEELMTMLSRRNTGTHSQSFGFENINMFTFKRRITGEQNTDCFFLKLWLTYIECLIAESMGDREGVVMESEWEMGYVSPKNWVEVCDVYKNYDIVFDGKTIGNDLCAVAAIGIGPYPKYAHHYMQAGKVVAPLPALYEIEADRGIILGIEDIVMEDDFVANPEVLRRHIVTLAHFLNAGESSAAAMRMAIVLSSNPRFIESGKAIVSNLSSSVCYRGSFGPDLWPRTIRQPPSDIYKDTNKANIVTALALTSFRLEGVMEELGGYTGWRTNGNRVTYDGLACVFNTMGLMEMKGREVIGDMISEAMLGGRDPLGGIACFIRTYCLASMRVGRRAKNIREPSLCLNLPVSFAGGWSEKFWKHILIEREMFELNDNEMDVLFNEGDSKYAEICEKRNIFNSWKTHMEVYSSTELALANGHTDIFRVPDGVAALYGSTLHLTLEYVRLTQRRDPTRTMRSLYSNESLPIERSNYAIMADSAYVSRERVENIPMPTEDLVFQQGVMRPRRNPAYEGASGAYTGVHLDMGASSKFSDRYGSHEVGAGVYINPFTVDEEEPCVSSNLNKRLSASGESAGGRLKMGAKSEFGGGVVAPDSIKVNIADTTPRAAENLKLLASGECAGGLPRHGASAEFGGGGAVLESTHGAKDDAPTVVPLGDRKMNLTEAALSEFSQKYHSNVPVLDLIPQAAGVYRMVADGTTSDVQFAYALALHDMSTADVDLMYIMTRNGLIDEAREMIHSWISGRHPTQRGTDALSSSRGLTEMQTSAVEQLANKGVLKEHASYAVHHTNKSKKLTAKDEL